MALSPEQMAKLAAAAREAGVDESELVAEAEAMAAEGQGGEAPAGGKPMFERMLIGAFPFVKVRELRKHWLGLSESFPDEELSCLEWELKTRQKYGGGASAPTADDPEE